MFLHKYNLLKNTLLTLTYHPFYSGSDINLLGHFNLFSISFLHASGENLYYSQLRINKIVILNDNNIFRVASST